MINAIKHLFPSADPLVDFTLQDNNDGKGPFIARWDAAKLGAQPTLAQLAAVKTEADTAQANRVSNAAIKADLLAGDMSIVRAIAEGDTVRIAAYKTAQAALRLKLKP